MPFKSFLKLSLFDSHPPAGTPGPSLIDNVLQISYPQALKHDPGYWVPKILTLPKQLTSHFLLPQEWTKPFDATYLKQISTLWDTLLRLFIMGKFLH